MVGDYNTMVYIAAQDPNCSLRVIGKPFFKSGYGIALQKKLLMNINIHSEISSVWEIWYIIGTGSPVEGNLV